MPHRARFPFRILVAALLALLLGACRGPEPLPADATPEFPAAWYADRHARGERVLRVDSAQSVLAVSVRRGGALARLGHDHVVSTRSLAGSVALDAGRADFYLDPEKLEVDDPTLRREAGLDAEVPQSAIAATRRNMLEKVLDASRHPRVFLHAERLAPEGNWEFAITLHGVTRKLSAAVHIENTPSGAVASGAFALRQSDFGITPFAVLGGALRVEDELALSFRVLARDY
ncbi:MAG: YceI family protein [Rhodocyclaceae bacterium]|nr:YceI family protein [Rhodocyclaceae bacterium]MBX3666874.1 YceI family protein [Rhodocyclaceae bacterium]